MKRVHVLDMKKDALAPETTEFDLQPILEHKLKRVHVLDMKKDTLAPETTGFDLQPF